MLSGVWLGGCDIGGFVDVTDPLGCSFGPASITAVLLDDVVATVYWTIASQECAPLS
jgi:hypothetical protein